MTATIKDWFSNKLAQELNLPHNYRMEIFCKIKESEKAVYCMLYCGYQTATTARRRCAWLPKSVVENLESVKEISDYDKAVIEFELEYAM